MKTHHHRFEPPHCPNPECRWHRHPPAARWWWRSGHYRRKASPTRIRRFFCPRCERYFSTQTFDTTYWLRRPDIQRQVWKRSVEGVAHRQAGRGLDVVHSTIQRHVERLGRHALLWQEQATPKRLPDEALVLDGMQTFEHSQYWPFDLNLVVGARSHFIHAFTDAELRRSGRMTPAQKARRAALEEAFGRPDPRATEKEVEAVLRLVLERKEWPPGTRVVLWSDDHHAYPRALAKLGLSDVDHRTVSSRESRTARNPLFVVNVLDMFLRHSTAAHRRETIAFARRRQAAAERLALFQVWRNFMNPASQRDPNGPTPAMRAGLFPRRVTLHELLYRRIFPALVELPKRLDTYYRRLVPTRAIPNGRKHQLKYAF